MTPEAMTIAIIAGGALLTLAVVFMLFWGDDRSSAFRRRLDRVSGNFVLSRTSKKESGLSLRRRTADSEIAFIDRLIKSTLPNPDKLRARLGRTGKNISLGEYLMINALLVLVLFLVFSFLLRWGRAPAFFAAVAAGLYIPHMIIGRMGDRRIRKFLSLFPEAIDTICRGLRAGLPVAESIATVGTEMPDPVGIEFRRVSDSVRVGRSLDESLWDVASRLDTPEYRFFIIALAIQRETGGNLAETLGNLADLLRKRRQLRLKIRAMSSEARASAMIIGSLPYIMFLLLYIINREYMTAMFTTTGGKIMLGGGIGWHALGIYVMRQMISFDI